MTPTRDVLPTGVRRRRGTSVVLPAVLLGELIAGVALGAAWQVVSVPSRPPGAVPLAEPPVREAVPAPTPLTTAVPVTPTTAPVSPTTAAPVTPATAPMTPTTVPTTAPTTAPTTVVVTPPPSTTVEAAPQDALLVPAPAPVAVRNPFAEVG